MTANNTADSTGSAQWESELTRLRILGEGASAVSFLCDWPAQQKQVVLKQYKHSFSLTDSQKVWRESTVLSSIDHERIPNYLGHYVKEQDGRRLLHLVIEYIDGMDLVESMSHHRWTLKEGLSLIHQLLRIVEYLQSLQPPILHRDIKSSNILLAHHNEWRVYLIDFGTAIDSIHSSLGATNNAGTIGYMAPEQISGYPEKASDVYSIGVVAWELLTRRRAQEYLVGFSFEWHVSVKHLPLKVVEWFESMLTDEPEMRFQSAEEALRALEALPDFDGVNTSKIDSSSEDWTVEATRRWLNIVEKQLDHRTAALHWLHQYGHRCNDGSLKGLYAVLHRVALKHSSFRVVEYLQDLVESTPMGRILLKDWRTSREQLKTLQEELSQVPSWRLVYKSRVRNGVYFETNRERTIQQQLFGATKSWLAFVGLPPKAALTLLSASRKDGSVAAPEYYAHLQENSIGMVQIPSSRTGELFISKLLTTQGLFTEVMGFNPSEHQGVLNPVDSVSWWDAVIFCNRLSIQLECQPAYHITDSQISEIEGSNGFRLPRWSDWKMAARGQQAHRFSGASDAHLVGWVDKSVMVTQRVAMKEANAWDIYDMTGNVAEWCWDDGEDPSTMEKRLVAGGSFRDGLEWVRTEAHNFEDPRFASHDLGFRIVRRLGIYS